MEFNRVVYLSLCGVTECVTGQRERLTHVPHHFTEISKGRLRRIENFVSGANRVDPGTLKANLAACQGVRGGRDGFRPKYAKINGGEPPELAQQEVHGLIALLGGLPNVGDASRHTVSLNRALLQLRAKRLGRSGDHAHLGVCPLGGLDNIVNSRFRPKFVKGFINSVKSLIDVVEALTGLINYLYSRTYFAHSVTTFLS